MGTDDATKGVGIPCDVLHISAPVFLRLILYSSTCYRLTAHHHRPPVECHHHHNYLRPTQREDNNACRACAEERIRPGCDANERIRPACDRRSAPYVWVGSIDVRSTLFRTPVTCSQQRKTSTSTRFCQAPIFKNCLQHQRDHLDHGPHGGG